MVLPLYYAAGWLFCTGRPIRTANTLSIPLMALLSPNAAVAVTATVLTPLFSVINPPIVFLASLDIGIKKKNKVPAVLHYRLILVVLLFAISADN
jgi:hypothetical protein